MFEQVGISICLQSDELTGLQHCWDSNDPHQPDDEFIGASDHARALYQPERLFNPSGEHPVQWIPHKRFIAPRTPDHLLEKRYESTGARFYFVKLQPGELPLEEEESLMEGLEQQEEPLEEGADAAAVPVPLWESPELTILGGVLPPDELKEIPAFHPDANGTAHHWNVVIKDLYWGKKTRHIFMAQVNNAAVVDVRKVIEFLRLRLDSTGKPVTRFLGDPVDMSQNRATGWYRCAWLGEHCTDVPSGGRDAEEPDWQKAWHGCKLEALYSIIFHGRLTASKDLALGQRFWLEAPGIYVHRDELQQKSQDYMRFVPLFRDGVLWASQWEVLVDRSRRVRKKNTDQWIQQEGSVKLMALWLYGRRMQDMEPGWPCQENWDPRLEANPRHR